MALHPLNGPAFGNVTRERDEPRAWHRFRVAYFRDLSPYTDMRSERVLAVGWLAAGEPFATGAFPDDLLACLRCRRPEVMSMGSHRCELCLPTANEDFLSEESQRVASGSHEHLIGGDGGITYAAPELIYHYIREHGYAPPEQFTAALRARCARRSAAEVRIATRWNAYESAVSAVGEVLEQLGIVVTHPSAGAQRLIFYDLRAKTRYGRLKRVEDIATILLHRAPSLSSDDARDAAAEVWTAWNRFLSNEEFEPDWLQIDGPPRYLESAP